MSFNILSIDGGGIRGVFPAYILKRVVEEMQINLAEHCDLVIGASTGSIIAAAVATSYPVEQIIEMYEKNGPIIFKKHPLGYRGIFGSQYDKDKLSSTLQSVFGDKTLSNTDTRLVIPAVDISNGNVFVFKSPYITSFVRDRNIKIADAVTASCAAPTYFNPHKIDNYLLCDGGLWANNPSLVALVEALTKLEQKIENVKILSIGTGIGHKYYDINKYSNSWGFANGWEGTKLIETILNLQSISAENMVKLQLPQKNYMRINYQSDRPLGMDNVSLIAGLKSRADQEFTYNSKQLREFLKK